jgi:hypothetical protein
MHFILRTQVLVHAEYLLQSAIIVAVQRVLSGLIVVFEVKDV